jgi:hypothetical protein
MFCRRLGGDELRVFSHAAQIRSRLTVPWSSPLLDNVITAQT